MSSDENWFQRVIDPGRSASRAVAFVGGLVALLAVLASLTIGVAKYLEHPTVRVVTAASGDKCSKGQTQLDSLENIDSDTKVHFNLMADITDMQSEMSGLDDSDRGSIVVHCSSNTDFDEHVVVETYDSHGTAIKGWHFIGGGMWSLTGVWKTDGAPYMNMGTFIYRVDKVD